MTRSPAVARCTTAPAAAVAAAALLLSTLLSACGGSSGPGPADTASTAAASSTGTPVDKGIITISDFSFGAPITVRPGATVTVVNKDSVPHDVVSDDRTSFSTPHVSKGAVTFTAPSTPGSYPFHCSIHPDMHGTLIVSG